MKIIKTDKKSINIGCGNKNSPEDFNVDLVSLPNIDLVYDITNMPWPFEDNHFNKVIFFDILEHLDNPLKAMEEIHRIMEVGGICYLHTSNWKYPNAYRDITHKRPFDIDTFDIFDPNTDYGRQYGYYSKCHFKVLIKREDGQELYFELQKL